MDEKRIARITIMFDDGSHSVHDNSEELIFIVVNNEKETFEIKTTENVDAYTILDFAHNAIKEIGEPQPTPKIEKRKQRPNHLKVVK